jgi:hypothetical protein
MLARHALPMMREALARGDWALLGLALDLAVPPLALLVLLCGGLWLLAGLAAWAGAGGSAWGAASALLALVAGAVLAAWLRWGHEVLGPLDLLRAPWYALSKLALYARFWRRRQKDWVRTERK